MSSISQLIRQDLVNFKGYSSARDEANGGKIWLNANELPWCHEDDKHLRINRYPDKEPAHLLKRLAEMYQVHIDQIACARGSDEAIDLLMRLFCGAGKDAIIIFPPTFGMYNVYAALQGAEVIEVPLTPDYQLNLEALHKTWSPKVKLIFVCSPNNPTGNLMPEAEVISLCKAYAGKSMIIVDEAYIEFSGTKSMARYINDYENLAVLRTLSKAYGLAGVRFGVLLAQKELVAWIKNITAPYPLPAVTTHAVNVALSPERLALLRPKIEEIKSERERVRAALTPYVTKIYPSTANFLLVKVTDADKVMRAAEAVGIIFRDMSTKPGLEGCLRISIGSIEENNAVISLLTSLG
jgi:histidinol-phosphate aminotransferase